MKAAIYSRVSTDQQDYSKQTEELKDYAQRNGIEIAYVFEEKESGFNNDRPEFEKLRKLTKQDIDIILVWEISRLSRRSIYLQQQIEDFTNKGICIYALSNSLQTINADGTINEMARVVLAVTATIAEQEAATLKARTLSGKRHKILKEGYSYTHIAPYGYNKDTKLLSVNEKEAEVVRRIFQLSIDGYSLIRIANELNVEGIKNKKGNKWYISTIRDMLINPVYMGKARYALKKAPAKGGKKYRKPLEFAEVDTPAIVSEEVFQLSLERMKGRKCISQSSYSVEYPLLRGLIVCPVCGRRYVYKHNSKLYTCNNKDNDCKAKGASAHKLESIIWDIIKIYFKENMTTSKVEAQIEPLQAEIESYKQKILLLDGQLSELTEEASRMYNAAIEAQKRFPNMPKLYEDKMKEVDSIDKEASRYEKEKELTDKKIRSISKKINHIKEARDINLDDITDKLEKYNIFHQFIDNLVICGTKHTSFIVLTLTTGQILYIGHYSKRCSNYYILFYPSSDIYFDIQTSKGYISHLKEKATINSDGTIYLGDFTGESQEYSIEEFIKHFDIEDNRRYL